jgi:hypothetical protein
MRRQVAGIGFEVQVGQELEAQGVAFWGDEGGARSAMRRPARRLAQDDHAQRCGAIPHRGDR